ncbi:C3a anaphylatoxin chemotactic receptor-like [Danio rerio]|uniref:C3a anaphylatoxin chemotactic receptor-like n=1 Tax=Danio rerio TaxID=7955 RepID=A0AB32T8K2_DANRE
MGRTSKLRTETLTGLVMGRTSGVLAVRQQCLPLVDRDAYQKKKNTSCGPENVTGNSTVKSTVGNKRFLIFDYIFLIIIIVGLIGNGLVIFLTGYRMKTTVNSIWFLNLAIADFIFLLISIIDRSLRLSKQHSAFMSYRFFMTTSLNLFASILFLVVISLDRCLRTWMPVWAQNNRTLRKARIICMIIWVSSIGYILPFLDFFKLTVKSLITYRFIVVFLIPFLIIASSYIAIGVKINRLKMGKQLRSYRLIITVILTFFICSFPFHVCWIFILTAKNNNWCVTEPIRMLRRYSAYLVMLNSCLNPFLYVFMCDDYKKKLKQSLVLVLETAFAEDHLDIKEMRQTQKDEQEKKTTLELLEM